MEPGDFSWHAVVVHIVGRRNRGTDVVVLGLVPTAERQDVVPIDVFPYAIGWHRLCNRLRQEVRKCRTEPRTR